MATVVKDFKVKAGLVVEGANATVGGYNVLKKDNAQDEAYIVGIIGGETLITSVSNEFDVSAGKELSIDRSVVDDYYDAAGSADTAEDNAIAHTDARETAITTAYQSYADTAEADAVTTANTYTDGRETAITTAYQSYADTAEADAVTTANAYTDGRETAITTAYQSYADTAEVDAKAYTDTRETAITTAYQAYADQAEVDAKAYTDQEVAALVDSAPELLDTLNELAAAIGDNPNYAADLATSVGERVAKAGDTMTGLLVLSADPEANLGAATKQYVDTAETDAVTTANSYTDTRETAITTAYQSYADTAEADAVTTANTYTDGEITTALTTAQGYANTAEDNAIAHADALDTDDIEEGSNNLYHTDVRAKTSAANLLTGASLTNITITGDETGLVITAENGVADSDTDDLTEGATNLYFTDARAVSALEAVVPNFTEIDINEVATQVAASSTGDADQNVVAYQFATASYRSAKFLVKVAYGTHTEVSEVLLTLDTSDNVAITEYAVVGTNGSASVVSADVFEGNVRLLVTPENNSSTIKVMGTLLV
jgi:hypothetical protein